MNITISNKNGFTIFTDQQIKFKCCDLEAYLIRKDIGTEFPYTIGLLVKDGDKFYLTFFNAPGDEYGDGSFPKNIQLDVNSEHIMIFRLVLKLVQEWTGMMNG